MTTPHNPPAFPRQESVSGEGQSLTEQDGMTLRDWFAGQLLANVDLTSYRIEDFQTVAFSVYMMAEEMLEQRSNWTT